MAKRHKESVDRLRARIDYIAAHLDMARKNIVRYERELAKARTELRARLAERLKEPKP